MSGQINIQQIREAFLKSREGAIMRCASIMMNYKRNDLAKQILHTAHIDREKFEVIKIRNT